VPSHARKKKVVSQFPQFRSSAASNGTSTTFLPTLSCESKILLDDSSQQAVFFRIGRAAWIRLRLRASNEHRFIVRVLRAREMNQAALPFP
jgi:hypothetical protein